MLCCSVLLLLVCGSLAASHPQFWTTSSTSSPGSGGRIRNLERSLTSGRSLEERALEGTGWYRNNDGILDSRVSRDVEGAILRSELPKYYCWFNHFSGCPRSLRSSRRRSLPKKYPGNLFMPWLLWSRQCYSSCGEDTGLDRNIRNPGKHPPTLSKLKTLWSKWVSKTQVSPIYVFSKSFVRDDISYCID